MRVRSRRQEPVIHAKTDSESALAFLLGLGTYFLYKSNIPQLTCFYSHHRVVSDHTKQIPSDETKPGVMHLVNNNINLGQGAPTTNGYTGQGTRLELV